MTSQEMSAENQKRLVPEKIKIVDTQIVKCSIDCPFNFSLNNVKGHEYDLEFDMAFNIEDTLVKTDFKLKITTNSNEKVEMEASGDFHFVYIFQVENLKELAVPDKNKEIALHGGLGNALASISYSTSRGLLFARLKGTALENFNLPVIDPNSLLKH
jgi:hypothetical protein